MSVQKHVMLDLETLGNKPNAVIAQIGAVYFDPHTGELGREFTMNVDVEDEERLGFDIDASTVQWWLEQSEEAKKLVFSKENRVQSFMALQMFNDFVQGAENIWSHATFDFVIIMNHFQKLKLKPNFRYSSAKDLRTLTYLGGVSYKDTARQGTHHNALDDCKFQCAYAVECFKNINKYKNGGNSGLTVAVPS